METNKNKSLIYTFIAIGIAFGVGSNSFAINRYTLLKNKNLANSQDVDRVIKDSKANPYTVSSGYYAKLVAYNNEHSKIISSQLRPSNVGKITTGFQLSTNTQTQVDDSEDRTFGADIVLNPRQLVTENWGVGGILVFSSSYEGGQSKNDLAKFQMTASRENLKLNPGTAMIPNMALTLPTTNKQKEQETLIGALTAGFIFANTDKANISDKMNVALILNFTKGFHKNKYVLSNPSSSDGADADGLILEDTDNVSDDDENGDDENNTSNIDGGGLATNVVEPKLNTSYSFQQRLLPEIRIYKDVWFGFYSSLGQKFNYENKMTQTASSEFVLKWNMDPKLSFFGGISTEDKYYSLYNSHGKSSFNLGLSGAF